MTKVAILGYGTVGSGVYEVLKKNKEVITGKTGEEITVKYVLDLREFDSDPVQEVLVHDIDTIISDTEISIVCETMGGERLQSRLWRRERACVLPIRSWWKSMGRNCFRLQRRMPAAICLRQVSAEESRLYGRSERRLHRKKYSRLPVF